MHGFTGPAETSIGHRAYVSIEPYTHGCPRSEKKKFFKIKVQSGNFEFDQEKWKSQGKVNMQIKIL